MLKSKSFDDYFAIPLDSLKSGEPIPFNVYLYFPLNRHILLWRGVQELITDTFLQKYRERGIDKVYLHKDDEALFNLYRAPGEKMPEAPFPLAKEPPPMEHAPTEAGSKIVEILQSPELGPEQKAEQISMEAREVFHDLGSAGTLEAQAEKNASARDIIRDVLEHVVKEAASIVGEVWHLADVNPDLEHAVNVSTQAVIFAMAFGRIDETLIADIALAGLLHDIGMTQVSASVTSLPVKFQKREETQHYADHVKQSLELIRLYAPAVSARAQAIILQHHEKFDGSGYPQGLQGFKVDDIAQLVGIADVLDTMTSGQWDGQKRTLKETFDTLEALERSRTFPEYFNPDVFAILMKWLRDPRSTASTEAAIQVVVKQSKDLMGNELRSA